MVATFSRHAEPNARRSGGFLTRWRRRLSDFWRRVSEGLELRVLWSQFISEAKESYSLYDHEVD